MKKLILLLLLACLCAGCNEELAVVTANLAAWQIITSDAQTDFIEAVNGLNVETVKINAMRAEAKDLIVIKPETIETLGKLKGREKDPVFWAALVSVIANAVVGGKAIGNIKKTQ